MVGQLTTQGTLDQRRLQPLEQTLLAEYLLRRLMPQEQGVEGPTSVRNQLSISWNVRG
jgi:hypothetical protein